MDCEGEVWWTAVAGGQVGLFGVSRVHGQACIPLEISFTINILHCDEYSYYYACILVTGCLGRLCIKLVAKHRAQKTYLTQVIYQLKLRTYLV